MIRFPSLWDPERWQTLSGDPITVLLETEIEITEDKFGVDLFGPYTLKPGGKRRNTDVVEVDHLVLDLDDVSWEVFAEITGRLGDFRGVVYSSHSHGAHPELVRARIVIPFAEKVPASLWRKCWNAIAENFPELDHTCKDVSRGYYFPATHPARLASAFRFELGGSASYPVRYSDAAPQATDTANAKPLAPERLKRVERAWSRSPDYSRQVLAEALGRVREGLPYAIEGERDQMTWALVVGLTHQIQGIPPETIAATLAPSLAVMGANAPTVVNVLDKAKRAASGERPKPVGLLSADAHAKITESVDCEDPERSLVLQADSDYYVLSYDEEIGCQYLPSKRESLVAQAKGKLEFTGVPLHVVTDTATRPMLSHEIVDRYGFAIDGVVRSHCIDHPEIRRQGAGRILAMPAALRRPLRPKFHKGIDTWLTLLGGTEILDWIALALNPVAPLAALFLLGAAGSGKSLLANGISALWTQDAPPELSRCLDNFNAELVRCPIVFADEDVPRDGRGRMRTEEFRDFIQRKTFRINEKHKGLFTLEGYPRVIVAANNDRVLNFGNDELTTDDLRAISQRIFLIRADGVPTEFLETKPREEIEAWVRYEIAEHALWLEKNHAVRVRGRFGVVSDECEEILFQPGLRTQFLELVVKYLFDPRCKTDTHFTEHALVVRTQDLEKIWRAGSDKPSPGLRKLAHALAAFPSSDGQYEIPLHTLNAWVRSANLGEVEFWGAVAAYLEKFQTP